MSQKLYFPSLANVNMVSYSVDEGYDEDAVAGMMVVSRGKYSTPIFVVWGQRASESECRVEAWLLNSDKCPDLASVSYDDEYVGDPDTSEQDAVEKANEYDAGVSDVCSDMAWNTEFTDQADGTLLFREKLGCIPGTVTSCVYEYLVWRVRDIVG